MTKKVQQTEIRTVTDYPRQSSECAQVKQNYEMFPTQVEGAVGDDIIITGNNKSVESQPTNEITSQETDASQTKWAIEEIQRISLKDSDGNEYITPEIKALFSDEKNNVNMNDLVDENGNIKKGYEIFDLNHDGKLDDLETSYFTSNGAMLKTNKKILTADNFINTFYKLDVFDNRYDKLLSVENRKRIYKFMTYANELMDELKDFPDGIRELYMSRLAELKFVKLNNKIDQGGTYDNNELTINDFSNKNYFKDVLFHELTHSVLDANPDFTMENITQEVVTHFMESRYYAYKQKEDKYPNFGYDFPSFIKEQYSLIEKSNPDITKLDIAKAVFMVNRFDEYASIYKQKDKDKYVYNANYYDIGGYFAEPSNKKEIYAAGIQKALSGATLKDENGKELITDEIRNLFTPEHPIATYHDFVDENWKIKPGFELFDLDGDGVLYTERTLFSYITYNDLPRLITMLDEWGNLSKTNKTKSKGVKATDGISTTESRKIIAEQLSNTDYSQRTFNFHTSNRGQLSRLY